MALVHKVCDPCKEGKHMACESPLPGGLDCACVNSDCIFVRADERIN